jgi:tetratricopeptide (TPR) repeat protein
MGRKMTSAPSESRSPGRRALTWGLIILWVLLMCFAGISALDPPWLRELSALGTDVESRAAKNTADAYLREHRYPEAIKLYEHALAIQPGEVGVLVNLAVAYGLSGRAVDAERILMDALRSGTPRPGVVAYNLAELLYRQNRLDEAIQYYRQALDSSVRQDRVYSKLGDVYLASGQYAEARSAYETALAILRDVATPYRYMLRRSLTTYEEFPESMEAIRRDLERGVTVEDLARYDLKIISELQRSDRDIAGVHYQLALVHARQSEDAAALEHLQQALDIWPGYPDATRLLRELDQ